MNLLQTWLHCLLAYKNLYPPSAFSKRDILGLEVPVASPGPLQSYLDNFFSQLRPHIPHLNHLQVLIMTPDGFIKETNTLSIDGKIL
jgi:hypothetical protein